MEPSEPSRWELYKENIQPLSSGRNMSLLKNSLDMSKNMADHEAEIELQVKDLEEQIRSYSGNDPIQAYINLIHFLDNQALQYVGLKKKLNNTLMECYRKFFNNSQYCNDKRYIDVIVKFLNDGVQEPATRLGILQNKVLKPGVGKTVSQIYICIADLQESMGKTAEALQTLKNGIETKAQPIEKLDEALLELEFRIARELAKSLTDNQAKNEPRNFGSSVPVFGASNDAPVFRNSLRPAVPVVSLDQRQGGTMSNQQKHISKPVRLFNGEAQEEEKVSDNEAIGTFRTVESILQKKSDKENQLNPSKWNKEDVALAAESNSCELPRERISVYTEEFAVCRPVPKSHTVVQQGILKDRKEGTVTTVQQLPTIASINFSEEVTEVPASLPREIPESQTYSASSSRISTATSTLIPPHTLMCARTVLPSGNQASFEHRAAERWEMKQKQIHSIENLISEKVELSSKLLKLERELEQATEREERLREKFEAELLQKAQREAQWNTQRNDFNERVLKLTNEISRYKEAVEEMQMQHEEQIEYLKAQHSGESDELKALIIQQGSKIDQLTTKLEQQFQQVPSNNSDSTCQNSVSVSGASSRPSSSSNENECTFIPRLQVASIADSLTSDRLLNGTDNSCMQSFMPPPSRATEISVNAEQSFNASVRMGGMTTVFGWRDDKTKFGGNFLDDDDSFGSEEPNGNGNGTEVEDFLPPPPPPLSRRLPFTLYESQLDSHSQSNAKSRVTNFSNKQENGRKSQLLDFKTLSENVAPLPAPVPQRLPVAAPVAGIRFPSSTSTVSARVAEIESLSSNTTDENRQIRNEGPSVQESLQRGAISGNTVGQTFTGPTGPTRPDLASVITNEDDEPFVPYQPPELPFDTSNLTRALAFGPPPLLNSTPQRRSVSVRRESEFSNLSSGNYVHTQKIPLLKPVSYDELGVIEGPMSPEILRRKLEKEEEWRRDREQIGFLHQLRSDPIMNESAMMPQNLSPIHETSKENRSSCTTGSSSGNMTSTRGATMSGASMFNSNSRSVSGGPRSVSGRYQ